jgi:aminocarboxymuconate-semialdehyde decarboxylase
MIPQTIDVHAHLLVPEVDRIVAKYPELEAAQALDARRNSADSLANSRQMVSERIDQLTRLERRLSDMTAAGVDMQVVSPSPSHYNYWADSELASDLCEATNSAVAAHVNGAPDRLLGLGIVPMQDPGLAADVLSRGMAFHRLRGIMISSYAPARDLSDPALEPLWAQCEALGAVVFLHPYGCTLDERLNRYYLSNIVGQPVENAVALSHLIFGGVLDRHPQLRIIAAHGGGYLPSYIGRSDHGWQVRPESHSSVDEPSTYLRRLWFDSLVHSPMVLRHLVETVGADRIVLGSDYPFDMGTTDPVGALFTAGLAPEQTAAIRAGNAVSLFGLTEVPATQQ